MLKKSICLILTLLISLTVVFSSACSGNKFTVRFHANGGRLVSGEEVQTVKNASDIVAPVYEKEGYVLSFDKIIANITEDTEVYAVWTPINYKLSFDANGGTFYNKTVSIALGGKLSDLPVPEKDGYVFIGWYIGEELITDGYKWNFTEDKVAKAQYVEDDGFTFSISYDLDGGLLANPKTYYKTYEGEFTLGEPTKDGYDFIGWKKDGTTEIKKPMVVSEENRNLKFIACYTPKTYEIRFNSNGGEAISTLISAVFDQEIGILPEPKRDGFVFVGWFIGDEIVSSGQKWTKADNVTLVAGWKEDNGKTFSISYNLAGGELDNTKYVYYSTDDDFYLPTPSKDGFVFLGYTIEGDSTVYNPLTIKKGSTGNIKVTAVWERLYTFRFELSREVRRLKGGNVYYDVAYCTVNGKSYVDEVRLTAGEILNLPTPKLENEKENQFTYDHQRKAYKYWVVDVKKEDLNGKTPDEVGLVLYSGDAVSEELLDFAVDGVITIRPRIITLHFS